MNNNIAILYFSGTGNTAIVAGLLKDGLAAGSAVELFRIEDILLKRRAFNPADYGLIGIGYPSYGFNVPPLVMDFARSLDGAAHNGVFLFMTCAGPCYINDIASYSLKRVLGKRGFNVIYEKVFVMPANVLIFYRDEIVKQLYNVSVKRARGMASDILSGKTAVRKDGVLAMLLRWTYIWCDRPFMKTIAMDFKVSKTCTRCLKCIDNCPKQNIKVKNGKVKFRLHCAGCYKCVYNCPFNAISGRLFNFVIFKKGYNIENVIQNEAINGDFINKDTKGIFRTLLGYLNE